MAMGPSYLDVGSVRKTFMNLDKKKRNITLVINKAKKRGVNTRETIELAEGLNNKKPVVVHRREAFVESVVEGMTVFQRKLFRTNPTWGCRQDIRNLTNEIFGIG